MKQKLLFIMILICLLALPAMAVTQSNDIYISPTGRDSNECILILPCETFGRAEELAEPGDVIHFLKGTYDEVYLISKSGTPKRPIKIIGHKAVLKSLIISGNYIIVSKIEVIGAVYHGIMTTGKHIVIQNSIVHNSVTDNGFGPVCNVNNVRGGWGSGIKVERGSEDITIKDNLVYENCGEGIAATMGKHITIINNTARDNYSVNIYVDNSSFTTVSNNHVICTGNGYLRYDRRPTGIAMGEEFYEGWGAQRHDNQILENIVNGCYEGISSWRSKMSEEVEENLIIRDNIVINETYHSISLYWYNQNVLIENNTIDSPIFITNQDGVTLLNNTVQEPTK